jgi:hypothetical protein
MRSILYMTFLVVIIFGCSKGQKQQPILFDISSLPCDMAKQPDVAKLCGISVIDMIFQTVTNTPQQKVCTYYKNVTPKPLPLINLTVEPNKDSSATSDALFEGLIKNGIPGMDGISKFSKFPDDRFKAVHSDSNPLYNQIYVEVVRQGLLIIEYDKSLIKDKAVKNFEKNLIELYLYGGPQL